MNLGITLKSAEKVFGPALPGKGREEYTLSAVPFAGGKGKKFAGVLGIQEGAKFYVHFPIPVDWSLAKSKKGTPDFINDLHESGPQGEQGREALVAAFLNHKEAIREKLRLKQDAANKKSLAANQKKELLVLRQRLSPFVGECQATLVIGDESISLSIKLTEDKSGKIKIAASI